MYIVTLISMIFLFPPCLQSYGSRKIGLWGRSWPTVRSAKRQRHSELKVFCSHHITYSVNSGTYLALTAETDAVPGQFAEESAGRTDSVVVTFTCLKRIFFLSCVVWSYKGQLQLSVYNSFNAICFCPSDVWMLSQIWFKKIQMTHILASN